MVGERRNCQAPTVLAPPMLNSFAFLTLDDDYSTMLSGYLPSNGWVEASDTGDTAADDFRMYEFKVRKCARGESHDWTDCPYAHPGEKARRRDPRRYPYSGSACPDFRKGNCKKGDACENAHGVFECWLHPTRYRTQPCKDGVCCTRRVCFFAHATDQLRVLSPISDSDDGSPLKPALLPFVRLPEVSSPPPGSPPVLPFNDVVLSLRLLQMSKVKSMPNSPGLLHSGPNLSLTRPGFYSLPSTPTCAWTQCGFGSLDEEPLMERVESGRYLREKIFEKLRKENPLDRVDPEIPDVGWVSDIVNG